MAPSVAASAPMPPHPLQSGCRSTSTNAAMHCVPLATIIPHTSDGTHLHATINPRGFAAMEHVRVCRCGTRVAKLSKTDRPCDRAVPCDHCRYKSYDDSHTFDIVLHIVSSLVHPADILSEATASAVQHETPRQLRIPWHVQ